MRLVQSSLSTRVSNRTFGNFQKETSKKSLKDLVIEPLSFEKFLKESNKKIQKNPKGILKQL